MAYKAGYRPAEVLVQGSWQPLEGAEAPAGETVSVG
jgi:arginyl-tRNA--protein-N-Asp/Glu arginylyltransferase